MTNQEQKELEELRARCALLEKELTTQRQRFNLVVESSNDGIWDWNVQTNSLYNSPRWKATLGFRDDELSPSLQTWSDQVHPDDFERVFETLQAHLRGETPLYRAEYRMRTKNGNFIWVLDRGKARFDEDGQPIHFAGSLTDLTDSKKSKENFIASKERMRTILECMNEGVLVLDGNGDFLYANDSLLRISKLSLEQIKKEAPRDPMWKVIHEDGSPCRMEEYPFHLTLQKKKAFRNECLGVYAPDNSLTWILVSAAPIFQPHTDILTGVVTTITDITATKKWEQQMRLTSQVFDNSQETIIITDTHKDIIAVNRAFETRTGFVEQDVTGQPLSTLLHSTNSPIADRIWSDVEEHGLWRGEIEAIRQNGDTYPALASVNIVKNQNNKITHYILLAADITERKKAEERIQSLAYYDALTHLPNRILLKERVNQFLATGKREKSSFAVMLIDMDRFKTINDSVGHLIGDELLRQVGTRLLNCVREMDTVSRVGGDEFVAVVRVDNAEGASTIAQRILDNLGNPYEIEGYRLCSTPSVGISLFPNDGEDQETLIKHADAAMYHAKEKGRHNYQFFIKELNSSALERMMLETGLREVVQKNQLSLHYQPQINGVSGDLIGAEALLRWQHPEHGMIAPYRFIPIAEETSLIVPIGEWIIEEVCTQIRNWLDEGLDVQCVSINVAARQLREPHFARSIGQKLAKHDLDPRYIKVELTESTLIIGDQLISQNLQGLVQLGIKISIDDFGTGYSSLSYLKSIHCDQLKIDQSFVQDLTNSADDKAIVGAVIGLSKNLRMHVIAEGVETVEQKEILESLGCTCHQGYYFSRPLETNGFTNYLRESKD